MQSVVSQRSIAQLVSQAAAVARERESMRAMSSRNYEFRGPVSTLKTDRYPELIISGPRGTGKTVGILDFINWCCWEFPGCRWLVGRKVRADLAKTTLATFEEAILGTQNPICANQQRKGRSSYIYPNGSEIVLFGFDRTENTLSLEADGVYINETIELTQDEWEAVGACLRHGVMPWHPLIGDTNPGPPTHWIKKREKAGLLALRPTTHKDNPRYFDPETGTLTAAGRQYIEGPLARLTGVRRQRMLDGLWVVAEGAVFTAFDTDVHVKNDEWLIANGWLEVKNGQLIRGRRVRRAVAAQDWGFTNPGSFGVLLIDGDGRKLLVYEIYRTRQLIDWWAEKAKVAYDFWGCTVVACDPSQPGFIEAFCNAGMNAVKAVNDIRDGINKINEALEVQPDGQPRLLIRAGCLPVDERDPELDDNVEPSGFIEEAPLLVWDNKSTKEKPMPGQDHSIDMMRYGVQEADGSGAVSSFTFEAANLYDVRSRRR